MDYLACDVKDVEHVKGGALQFVVVALNARSQQLACVLFCVSMFQVQAMLCGWASQTTKQKIHKKNEGKKRKKKKEK